MWGGGWVWTVSEEFGIPFSGFRVVLRAAPRTSEIGWVDAHLNLADGEGEGSIAVVVLDDLKLVLLADVEHRGGLCVCGG